MLLDHFLVVGIMLAKYKIQHFTNHWPSVPAWRRQYRFIVISKRRADIRPLGNRHRLNVRPMFLCYSGIYKILAFVENHWVLIVLEWYGKDGSYEWSRSCNLLISEYPILFQFAFQFDTHGLIVIISNTTNIVGSLSGTLIRCLWRWRCRWCNTSQGNHTMIWMSSMRKSTIQHCLSIIIMAPE